MISYEHDPEQTIPESSAKIIGLGGAGANILDRVGLDGLASSELLSINTDLRTLQRSVAKEKIQIGKALTMGLGCGGDPELGNQAAQESEESIREAIRGHQIIFLCVGLGGGTGSGAAPLITRIAREENAFVVIFATMPFNFEGKRRRQQADEALNELAVLANALVTFENGRMGELILAKNGIHEAFAAADRMISESIKAVIRLVVRPGIINVGLDDLVSALDATRSRCLFGSGISDGENRSHAALENALTSPLLDKGGLLKDSTTVLVHICGGESLTLYEVELLMQKLAKYVPDSAHILFGAAVDPTMGDSLSVTIISALPEEKLNKASVTHLIPTQSQPDPVETEAEEPTVELDEEEASQEVTETPSAETIEETADSSEEEPAETPIEETEEATATDEAEIPSIETTDSSDSASEEAIDSTSSTEEKDATPSPEKKDTVQPELELGGKPRGKFEGENPNLHDGEDLDVPPFLRKKK